MAGWFELSKSSDNQFRFVLKRAMVRLSSPASCIPQKPLRKRASRRCVATARKKNAMRKNGKQWQILFQSESRQSSNYRLQPDVCHRAIS